jgi:hypothetical protein
VTIGDGNGVLVGCGLNDVIADAVARGLGVVATAALWCSRSVVVSTPASSTTVAMPTTSPPNHWALGDCEGSKDGGAMVTRSRSPRRSRSSLISGTIAANTRAQVGERAGEVTAHSAPSALEDASDFF